MHLPVLVVAGYSKIYTVIAFHSFGRFQKLAYTWQNLTQGQMSEN
jgi:hypothetical protein